MVVTNPNKIKLHEFSSNFLIKFKKGEYKHLYKEEIVCITWGGGACIGLKKISDNKWELFKLKEQTEPTYQKTKLTDYLKSQQYIETVKDWRKGFVMVYLDKKTWRIKHTMNNTKGSRLYTKTYKETIKYFERINQ